MEFMGYVRPDGKVGARNYVGVIPSVTCANDVAQAICRQVMGTVSFLHHQGCCQMPPDLERVTDTLISLGKSPNLASVLVVSLGCEGTDHERMVKEIAATGKHVEIIHVQELGGVSKAIQAGTDIARRLVIEASGLQAVTLGDSEKLNVGDRVLAIGNPLGDLTFSMSGGMVSSVNRTINVDGTPFNMIQTDTSINPGNSGGPLLNSYGEVVGIVSAKYSSYGSSGESVEGLGFAIPINDVISMIQDIMTNGYVSNKAYLGATIGTLTSGMAQQYRYDISQGAFVYSVEDGSPAAAAGLQLGDVITAIDGTEITSLEDLTAAKKGYAAGDTSTLTVYRQGETITLELTWGAVSADQQSAVQGQTEQDQNTQNGGGYTNPYTTPQS